MTNIPDVNLMREVADEKTAAFKKQFVKSEIFAKMCSDIQDEANKGNFSKQFNMNGLGGSKAALAARDLFVKGGYTTSFVGWNLKVSWGRIYADESENV